MPCSCVRVYFSFENACIASHVLRSWGSDCVLLLYFVGLLYLLVIILSYSASTSNYSLPFYCFGLFDFCSVLEWPSHGGPLVSSRFTRGSSRVFWWKTNKFVGYSVWLTEGELVGVASMFFAFFAFFCVFFFLEIVAWGSNNCQPKITGYVKPARANVCVVSLGHLKAY